MFGTFCINNKKYLIFCFISETCLGRFGVCWNDYRRNDNACSSIALRHVHMITSVPCSAPNMDCVAEPLGRG